jgi:hypothetical protein
MLENFLEHFEISDFIFYNSLYHNRNTHFQGLLKKSCFPPYPRRGLFNSLFFSKSPLGLPCSKQQGDLGVDSKGGTFSTVLIRTINNSLHLHSAGINHFIFPGFLLRRWIDVSSG